MWPRNGNFPLMGNGHSKKIKREEGEIWKRTHRCASLKATGVIKVLPTGTQSLAVRLNTWKDKASKHPSVKV